MSKPIKNIQNKRFGRLVALKYDNDNKKWECLCDCGKHKLVSLTHLQDGHTKSCGCLQKETSRVIGKNNTKHGMHGTRIYNIWRGMKSRCYYNHNKCYNIYGGRGIIVCDEWLDKNIGFINFFEWSVRNGYDDSLTIDRIDTNGNYEPSNCRWITMLEQQSNKRNVIKARNRG